MAVQYAKIFGGTVAAVDITDEKLKLATELGADIIIDARAENPAEVLQQHGGADVAVGLAVDDRSFATAYAGLRRGGRLVLVALPASGTLRIPVFDTSSTGPRSSARSSAPAPISSTCSRCMPRAGPR
jgi:propanol-preferring alcohol dehydrogenase